MPNNTSNIFTFRPDWEKKETLQTLKSKILDESGRLSFEKIIPQPENIFLGSLGDAEIKMCKEQGRPNWHDWNTENWGTKWGSYAFGILSDDEDEFSIYYETAWSSAEPIVDKVFGMCKELEISVCFTTVCEGGWFANFREYDAEKGEDVFFDAKTACSQLQDMMRIIDRSKTEVVEKEKA